MPEVEVHSPFDGQLVGSVPDQSAAEVSAVVSSLREAQVAWELAGVDARVRWLRAYRDWLLDNADRLNRILQSETGKPWAEANLEVPGIVDLINYYADRASALLADRRPKSHSMMTATKRQLLVHRPYAVVGNITAWNFPLALSIADMVPALLAGCAAVVKPSDSPRWPYGKRSRAGPRSALRRCSRVSREWARPAPRWSTRSTTCSSPAPPAPAS